MSEECFSANPGLKKSTLLVGLIRRLFVAMPILFVGGLLLLNLFLRTAPFKKRFDNKLSHVAHAPVSTGRISYAPWSGLRIRDLAIAAPEDASLLSKTPFFRSDSAWAKIRLRPLLNGIVEISEVGLLAPRIACIRGEQGNFLLPFQRQLPRANSTAPIVDLPAREPDPGAKPPEIEQPANKEPSTQPPKLATETPLPTPVAPSPRPVISVPSPKPPRKKSLHVEISEVVIQRGSLTLLGSDGQQPFSELRDFEMRVNLTGESTGTLRASSVSVLDHLEVRDLAADVSIVGTKIRVSKLTGTWDKGEITGNAEVNPSAGGLPFLAHIESGFDLAGLAPELIPPTSLAKADHPTATFDIYGFATKLDTVRGALRFENLAIPRNAIHAAAQKFGLQTVREVSDLNFEIARVHFMYQSSAIVFNEVNFNADQVVLRGVGQVTPGGDLDFIFRGYVPSAGASAIGRFTHGWPKNRLLTFEELENTTYIYRDVPVEGNLRNPLIDLWGQGRFFTVGQVVEMVNILRDEARARARAPHQGAESNPGP
jgi:hypothetical protein